jgi:hypothetical protein
MAKRSAETISLPKGGGAQRGMGEKFSPDLHTGTGNFTVPIALPPGRNGFHPQVNLVYSMGNGNGPFGLGWNLSIPGIARKTSHGIPRYRDSSADSADWDTFVLSGAEDLVPVRNPDLQEGIAIGHEQKVFFRRSNATDPMARITGKSRVRMDYSASMVFRRQLAMRRQLSMTRPMIHCSPIESLPGS